MSKEQENTNVENIYICLNTRHRETGLKFPCAKCRLHKSNNTNNELRERWEDAEKYGDEKYPESVYELDEEKVLVFIEKELHQREQAIKAELLEKVEATPEFADSGDTLKQRIINNIFKG